LNLDTYSHTANSGSEFKLTLDRVFCVDKVKYLRSYIKYDTTWTCTHTDCSSCEGGIYNRCHYFTVTVTTSEGASSEDVVPVSDCKYGDTVIIQRTGGAICVYEIAVIGKQGELTYRYVRNVNCVRYSTRSM
jgi:hypothetical protein